MSDRPYWWLWGVPRGREPEYYRAKFLSADAAIKTARTMLEMFGHSRIVIYGANPSRDGEVRATEVTNTTLVPLRITPEAGRKALEEWRSLCQRSQSKT